MSAVRRVPRWVAVAVVVLGTTAFLAFVVALQKWPYAPDRTLGVLLVVGAIGLVAAIWVGLRYVFPDRLQPSANRPAWAKDRRQRGRP